MMHSINVSDWLTFRKVHSINVSDWLTFRKVQSTNCSDWPLSGWSPMNFMMAAKHKQQ